GSHWAVGHLM
uniref:Neuromedin-C n=1 Tax=Pelophylax ridibundus TaxID=8406 RepID=GRP_PELRI|nr:RecName: Full=Neuromedin-C [Pelophylax ridibundus]AAB19410.1 neuromedin C=gastrin-releasing peptide [Rana ridibunda, brain, Peptide Partial, 10 aa] [Pelophylax ridibundus]